MDFTLKFKDTEDYGWPAHRSSISYYVLEDNFYLSKELHPQYEEITYEWYSSCHEVQEYYCPKTQGHFNLGDSKPSEYFSDDENESHRTVYLGVNLGGYHHKINNNDELPRIAWQYTHDFQRTVARYQGKNYFPCFDINNLLREGVVVPLYFDKVAVGKEGNQYFHIYGAFSYQGGKYSLKLSQDCSWEDGDWVTEGQYGKVSVFEWSEL